MKRLNNWIANRLASFMATMLLFWLLMVLDIAGAIVDPPQNVQAWLLWGVSILFQSVALPILALVSNQQGDRVERLLRETHDATLQELADQRALHEELQADMAELRMGQVALQTQVAEIQQVHTRFIEALKDMAFPTRKG